MHRRYGGEGLACLSVTVDEVGRKDVALAFLRSQGAAFENYLLDEPAALWQERWNILGVPAVFVFDRDGKRAAKFGGGSEKPFDYADVERLVGELLRRG
jgi:hypothetical protein